MYKDKKEITNTDIALEVINFSKRYTRKQDYAVKNATFIVNPGEFHGFIGANGAGKTTTIKSLIGAYGRFEGEIRFFGLDAHSKEAKKRMGYIPEAANFPKNMSAYAYIRYMANLSGLSWKDASSFSKETLEKVGLGKVMKRSPNTFSSGQKKKVLLAQALVANPDIIIMDEPAANLDPQARIEFFNTLKDLQRDGKAIFISSHILSELEKYVTHITIVDGGKIVYTGDVKKLTHETFNEYIIETKTLEDAKKIVQYLNKKDIKNSISNKNDHIIFAEIDTDSKLFELQKFCIASKIALIVLSKRKRNLDDVYEEFIKLGSVDTGGDDIKNRPKGKGVKNA